MAKYEVEVYTFKGGYRDVYRAHFTAEGTTWLDEQLWKLTRGTHWYYIIDKVYDEV